jgi:hypothetical protein
MGEKTRRIKDRKYHYIYKITRDDGKYYIGLHSTDNLDDGYFGSGQVLWHSIRAHGKEKHSMEILEFFDSRDAINEREKQLVSLEEVKSRECLNLRCGGSYAYRKPESAESSKKKSIALRAFYDSPRSLIVREKISVANTGKTLTDEHKRILSKTCARTVKRLKETGEWEEVKRQNSLAHIGKKQSDETKLKRVASIKKTKDTLYGGKYTFSDKAKANISAAQLGKKRGPYEKRTIL